MALTKLNNQSIGPISEFNNPVSFNSAITTAGGIYLGGTGAANYLDDYETGTWTPSVKNTAGTVTYNSGTDYSFYSSDTSGSDLAYVKIGNTVFIRAGMKINNTITERFNITLPFTVKNTVNIALSGSLGFYGFSANSVGFISRNSNSFDIFNTDGSGNHTSISYASGDEVYINFTYETT